MRFHYYGQPQDVAGYGYYGEAPQFPGYAGYGHYAEPPQYPGYAGYGHYAQPEQVAGYGYYGEPEPVAGYGYYGQPEPVAGYGYYGEPEPVGYFAEEMPVGYYGDDPNMTGEYQTAGYGQVPEMVGYGDGYGDGEPFAEEYPGVSDYAEDYSGYDDYAEYGDPGVEGYVRDVPSPFNAGCPLPLNTGLAAGDDFAGYSKPGDVSPSCSVFAEQPGSPSMVPDTLRPLW